MGFSWMKLLSFKMLSKADKIIDQASDSNHYQDWLNGIKDVYQLWKDDPILRQKVTDAGKVIWSEVEGIFNASGILDTKNRQDTIQTNIQNTVSTIETTLQQKLESTIGLSWTQVKAVAQSGQIITKAIADNKTEQWIQASDEILSIWDKDSGLRQVLKDKYNIDWANIKASVSSGQNLAKAVEANTVPGWGTALQNIINIWAETTTLTPQQQEKLQQTNNFVNQVKASNNSQDWLAVTNQIIDLWKDETAFQIQLQQNNQLSWQDISNSVKSGQVLALEQNGLEQWLGNLKNVVDIWKSDPEIKTIVENVSDLNWQSISNIINYNSATVNFINGDDNNNNLVGTAENDYIDAKDGNDYLDGGVGNDTLYGKVGADILIGSTGNDQLYLGAEDGVVDIVKYAFGDGADTLYQFMRGVGGDQIQFTEVTNIDVVTSGSNTLLRLGDGTTGNADFGTGELLVTLSGTSGFSATDVNINLFGTNFLFS
jgi:RTX calcium-binding nonapeptide repeat (4 copies)